MEYSLERPFKPSPVGDLRQGINLSKHLHGGKTPKELASDTPKWGGIKLIPLLNSSGLESGVAYDSYRAQQCKSRLSGRRHVDLILNLHLMYFHHICRDMSCGLLSHTNGAQLLSYTPPYTNY